MNHQFEFDEWLESQKRKARRGRRTFRKIFIGERSYPHLDGKLHYPRIGHDVTQGSWLREVVSDYSKLARHGFLPFIRDDKRQRRFRAPPNDYEYSGLRGGRNQKLFPHIKSRPIMYASHRDACIFSFYSYLLQTRYEQVLLDRGLEDDVIAYRSIDGKNNVDFAKMAFDEMQNRSNYECLMLDVKGFFDNLDHKKLMEHWGHLLENGLAGNPDHELIFRRITRYRYLNFQEAIRHLRATKRRYLVRKDGCLRLCSLRDYNACLKKTVAVNTSGKGIPQGSPISGILANIYLLDFDAAMHDAIVVQRDGFYQRYSDDIFIICPLSTARDVYDELSMALKDNKLDLGPDKTEAYRMQHGNNLLQNITAEVEPNGNGKREQAQYLGFHFDGQSITFRPSTLSKHIRGNRKPDYLRGAYKKINTAKVARQLNKIRRVVHKKSSSD